MTAMLANDDTLDVWLMAGVLHEFWKAPGWQIVVGSLPF